MRGGLPVHRHSRESGERQFAEGNPGGVGAGLRRRLDSRFRGSDGVGPSKEPSERGFTLVELIVVIVIIGLAAAAVVLAVPDTGGSVQAEAERFAARAKAGRDWAIVESRPVALTLDDAGYRIERRVDGAWRPASVYEWAEGTAMEANAARTRFDSTGVAEPLSLTLRRRGRAVAVDIGADGNVHVRR